MSRNADYQFVSTDTGGLVALLVMAYEQITGVTVQPGSPERLFIQWAGSALVQERVLTNYAGNQNIPSRAEGANLDALGELFLERTRPAAKAAVCTVRFSISEAQNTAILIPAGTRVTDTGGGLIWATEADAYIPIGETAVELPVQCQTTGTIGNGYAIGQINRLVDLYDYYSGCANVTVSDGGADEATDEEYYQLMRDSMDGYSCAGSAGGYRYWARQVSTEIRDVIVDSPSPGVIKLYVLMEDGTPASQEMKQAVLAACSADTVRPLGDQVLVEDAETVPYEVNITYYLQRNTAKSAAETTEAVNAAVAQYTSWQSAKLGRDINPSYLVGLLMQTGIKRVELAAPAFTTLRDGGDKAVPQVARLEAVTITNGGYEDE